MEAPVRSFNRTLLLVGRHDCRGVLQSPCHYPGTLDRDLGIVRHGATLRLPRATFRLVYRCDNFVPADPRQLPPDLSLQDLERAQFADVEQLAAFVRTSREGDNSKHFHQRSGLLVPGQDLKPLLHWNVFQALSVRGCRERHRRSHRSPDH